MRGQRMRARLLAGTMLVLATCTGVRDAGASEVRFATFNASLNRGFAGQLIADLARPDDPQAKRVAEIIQIVDPDVLLINEFDYDAGGEALASFQENYLGVGQNGAAPVDYPYVYLAPANTGIASGFDLDNNGVIARDPDSFAYADDAFGFGTFPGQYGFVVLSKYEIDAEAVRTFQTFLWRDMPGALLPVDPESGEPFYSDEEREVLRLSSKSHWDVPVLIEGEVVHTLLSHPTPPVFDGPEDRNGRRNHDEIRFWADYVVPPRSGYIYDDAGTTGGLPNGAKFVIMGDQNADPRDGDSTGNAARQLLRLGRIDTSLTPSSEGGVEAAALQGGINDEHRGDPAFDTGDFDDEAPGNLRVDYVLPSHNLEIVDAGVFWPTRDDPRAALIEASDHRLVWVDLKVR